MTAMRLCDMMGRMWQGRQAQQLLQRLRDVPVLAARDDAIDAAVYNLWRRARLRLGPHVEIPMAGGMRLVLEDQAWAVVDDTRHGVPVLAWLQFSALKSRSSLHEPITCRLHYYHYMASSQRAPALRRMQEVLTRRLRHG